MNITMKEELYFKKSNLLEVKRQKIAEGSMN
jgi:hypothetical protein